ncbi:MAG: KEOPS complex kinase/ATPase Bud32 [Candidatus Hodarchaeota archaeon]
MSRCIAKGAEASLFLEDWYGYQVIRKHRLPKTYRVPHLDQTIRNERTLREARLLAVARSAGVPTPIIYNINPDTATILMEFIKGQRLKELIPNLAAAKLHQLFRQIGEAVGRLHHHQVAHGDLTTSNLLLAPQNRVYFIDFGLATITRNVEDYGTDLHLLRRALLSAHYPVWEDCYLAFVEGYSASYGAKASAVFRKVKAIESRGRYISERIR